MMPEETIDNLFSAFHGDKDMEAARDLIKSKDQDGRTACFALIGRGAHMIPELMDFARDAGLSPADFLILMRSILNTNRASLDETFKELEGAL